jgi:hypothetical protein
VIAFHVHHFDAVLEEDGRNQVFERGGLLSTVALRGTPVNPSIKAVV